MSVFLRTAGVKIAYLEIGLRGISDEEGVAEVGYFYLKIYTYSNPTKFIARIYILFIS